MNSSRKADCCGYTRETLNSSRGSRKQGPWGKSEPGRDPEQELGWEWEAGVDRGRIGTCGHQKEAQRLEVLPGHLPEGWPPTCDVFFPRFSAENTENKNLPY